MAIFLADNNNPKRLPVAQQIVMPADMVQLAFVEATCV